MKELTAWNEHVKMMERKMEKKIEKEKKKEETTDDSVTKYRLVPSPIKDERPVPIYKVSSEF